MKFIALVLFLHSLVFAKQYYAKVEPYDVQNISSNVSGLVVYINEDMIGKKLSSKEFIKIDSQLDEKELNYNKQKLKYYKNNLASNQIILKNINELLKKKRVNYEKIKSLSIKSVVEKDREFYDLVNSENQLLNTMKEVDNLKIQIADLNLRQARLIRSLKDKNLTAKNFTLVSLFVRAGQVVTIATPLAQVANISKGKLSLYLDEADLVDIENKKIFIDGIATDYKASRISYIADSKNISKYKVQIIIDAPKVFSKLVKVELR